MSPWWYAFFAFAACFFAWLIVINIDYYSLPRAERQRLWRENQWWFWW